MDPLGTGEASDRREADAEGAGGLGFGHAVLDGGNDHFAQILGVGSHEGYGRISVAVGQQLCRTLWNVNTRMCHVDVALAATWSYESLRRVWKKGERFDGLASWAASFYDIPQLLGSNSSSRAACTTYCIRPC